MTVRRIVVCASVMCLLAAGCQKGEESHNVGTVRAREFRVLDEKGETCAVLVAQVCASYHELRDNHCPQESESNCFVCPEAVVAVNAFLRCQERAPLPAGLYYICDVGAGTLDVAFFRYAPSIEKAIVCYESSCTRVGGDSFAEILARHAADGSSAAFSEALEQALRDFAAEPKNAYALLFKAKDKRLQAAVDRVLKIVQRGRNLAFERSRRKERSWSNWHGLRGVVIGGGRYIPRVENTLFGAIGYGHPDETIFPERTLLDVPLLDGATELHRIAYGLSIPIAEYYGYWLPKDVEDISADSRGRERLGVGEDSYRTTG